MTREEAYDLACQKWGVGAALVREGVCIVGRWLPLAELGNEEAMLHTKKHAFAVLGKGATWEEALRKACT